MEITVLKDVINRNNNIAQENRELLKQTKTRLVNMISSPGAGKTTLLEKTLPILLKSFRMAIIEGDAYTSRDAERLQFFDIPIVQINTEGACHLDSNSINHALNQFNLNEIDVVLVENIGNLICPAHFDLGEEFRIAVLSTTEGDDKPIKYPMLFRDAEAMVLNKIDLLPYIDFRKDELLFDVRKINPYITIFETSATKNEGIEEWAEWLKNQLS
jgi:hydrogenase nickel incorporation protein HypB